MKPGTDEWNRLVTASKVAAILGVSPWESPYSMWRKMRGDLPAEPQSDAMSRGHYLEPAILAWWRDRHGVDTDPFHWREQPKFTLGDWAAATPDAVVEDNTIGPALVEAKSTAYDDDWGDPGTDVIPAYYLVQVQWQMHVSGIRRCYVPVIGPRLRFAEYVVDYDEATGPLLERRCREFYDSLSSDVPPPLDDTVATFNAVRKVHRDIERGESVELDADLAHDLASFAASARNIESTLRLKKSRAIEQMGRAQYATHNGVRIARRQPRGDDVTFVVTARPSDLTAEQEAS